MRLRNTWAIIADFVGMAASMAEAKKLVDEEVAKGDCAPIPERLRDERIERLWAQKVKAVAAVRVR